jgi:hypothetical protein
MELQKLRALFHFEVYNGVDFLKMQYKEMYLVCIHSIIPLYMECHLFEANELVIKLEVFNIVSLQGKKCHQ